MCQVGSLVPQVLDERSQYSHTGSSVWSVLRATSSVDLHVEWLLQQEDFKPDAMRTTGNSEAFFKSLLAKQEEVLLRCLDAYTVNETVLGVTKRPFFHSAQDKAAEGKQQRKRFAEQSADVDELHAVEDDYDEVELEAIQQAVATDIILLSRTG